MTTTTSMPGMSMTTTGTSPTASSHDSHGSSGMGMSSSSMMSAQDMAMVFFQSVSTPLISSAWTPSGSGTYAGTCIFLIVLAVSHRVLIALRCILFERSLGNGSQYKVWLGESDVWQTGGPERTGQVIRSAWNSHPFRVGAETCRGVLEVIIGGVGYLL
jgi:solute carrier family 31 (copper transporter), member 1